MSQINKRNLYTAAGIVLSLLMVFGGWELTRGLIDKKERELFAVVGSVRTDPPVALPASKSETPDVFPTLTGAEIAAVLSHWVSEGRERPHEPMEGQLTMEQAIKAAEEGLAFFIEQEVLPSQMYQQGYGRTASAKLCVNQPYHQTDQNLAPYYSYWVVSFPNEQYSLLLRMNAVTGQIWSLSYAYPEESISADEAERILDVFISYLGMESQGVLNRIPYIVSKGLYDNAFSAAADWGNILVTSVGPMMNAERTYNIVHLYLTAQTFERN